MTHPPATCLECGATPVGYGLLCPTHSRQYRGEIPFTDETSANCGECPVCTSDLALIIPCMKGNDHG